ncbi:MAG: hypothetical protein H7210_14630 [Pyrinomonadaceae bacterium]|nr:hypothetical protein [Phycisphaerales bacterium]
MDDSMDQERDTVLPLTLVGRARSVPLIAVGVMVALSFLWIVSLLMFGTAIPRVDSRLLQFTPSTLWLLFYYVCWRRGLRFSHYLAEHQYSVCPNCAYPLTPTNEQVRCPECGRAVDGGKLQETWKAAKIPPGWYRFNKG